MWEKVIAANKAVQESGIYKYAKGLFYEDGLRTASREGALADMEKNASDQYIDSINGLKKNGMSDQADALKMSRRKMDSAATKNLKNPDGVSAEAYKDMSMADQERLSKQAAVKAALNNSNTTNADLAMGRYQKALKASKREMNVRTGLKMTKDYFAQPFTDGRIGTGVARAGAATAGVGTVGAITYSLTGGGAPDYSANYSSSSSGGTTQDF
jgi:hypothetical protein